MLLEEGLAAESLLVAPHRVLHLLPWPGLMLDGRRLFEYAAVGILPNLTCAELLGRRFTSAPRAALIGAPDYTGLGQLADLPQVGAELADLAVMYRDRNALVTAPVTARAATEAAFRELAGRVEVQGAILHAACHGTLESGEPMASGLLLCDGKVDAGELALSRLGYDEVVLSACSTGWRPLVAENVPLTGDDVLGLPGGLLEAGAGAVLVSIPKADDAATRAFMTRYHHARSTRSSPLQSFRAAQLAMLQDAFFHPFSWIGFVSYACR
ncbi:MAG: CHAT domain-containing protein [Pseudonocardiaceae bacterium]